MSSKANNPSPVLTQILGVSYQRDLQGRESLVYAQAPHPEVPPPEPVEVPIGLDKVNRHILAIRRQVENLTVLAMHGQRCVAEAFTGPSRELAKELLPATGFAGLVSRGAHPQLDILQDAAGEIPWEAMEEHYLVCEGNEEHRAGEDPERRYCSICSLPMRPEGGKVVLRYHLSHLVRGEKRPARPGRRFLLIEDPRGDLLTDESDPKGSCRAHLREIRERLEAHGFEIESCRAKNAKVRCFLNYLTDPSIVGLYYFGHGGFPQSGPEGYLELADGRVSASEIEKAAPSARFVFLNACWGASSSSWKLEGRNRSVAAAFARGGHKVVIAPMWPVVNVHAAETARQFFRHASPAEPSGEAMRRAREASLERFEQGEPHLSWMAYRYFGDPESSLPVPEEPGLEVRTGVFNDRGGLNKEIFSFEIEPILLRAVKRRMLERRPLLEVGDIVAGMVRAGDLTRGLIRRLDFEPDRIYDAMVSQAQQAGERAQERDAPGEETGDETAAVSPSAEDPLGLKELLSEWLVRERRQLSPELQEVFEASACAREHRSEDDEALISERDLLEALLASDGWHSFAELDLPAAEPLRRMLADQDDRTQVDDDGSLRLDFLRPEAKKVIRTAHVLAQQRGVFPITHRLLFAAFLAEPKGAAAKRLAGSLIPVPQLHALIVAASQQQHPKTFGLSPEACAHIVLPTLEAARQKARDAAAVSEDELFLAFCRRASPEFKYALRKLGIDLDLVGGGREARPPDPRRGPSSRGERTVFLCEENFEPGVWRLLLEAARLARGQGWAEIRTPHLFAAMLNDPTGPAAEALRKQGLDPETMQKVVLSAVVQPDLPAAGAHTARVLERGLRAARSAGRSGVAVEDLWETFFTDGGGVVGQLLRQAGFEPPASRSRSTDSV